MGSGLLWGIHLFSLASLILFAKRTVVFHSINLRNDEHFVSQPSCLQIMFSIMSSCEIPSKPLKNEEGFYLLLLVLPSFCIIFFFIRVHGSQTFSMDMLQVHPFPQVQVGHLHRGLVHVPSSALSGFPLAKLSFLSWSSSACALVSSGSILLGKNKNKCCVSVTVMSLYPLP